MCICDPSTSNLGAILSRSFVKTPNMAAGDWEVFVATEEVEVENLRGLACIKRDRMVFAGIFWMRGHLAKFRIIIVTW